MSPGTPSLPRPTFVNVYDLGCELERQSTESKPCKVLRRAWSRTYSYTRFKPGGEDGAHLILQMRLIYATQSDGAHLPTPSNYAVAFSGLSPSAPFGLTETTPKRHGLTEYLCKTYSVQKRSGLSNVSRCETYSRIFGVSTS